MDEASDRSVASTAPERLIVVRRVQRTSMRAWRAGNRIKIRVGQAKLTAHRRAEPFWPATTISIFVTLAFYIWTLNMIGVQFAWVVGCAAIGSNLTQEVGHWLAMTRAGYRAHFLFLPWIVWLLPKDPDQYQHASRWHKSLIAISGPAVNVGLIVIGGCLAWMFDWQIYPRILVSVNAGIATMSLLPIPFLDGGKMLKNLLESVGVVHDRMIAGIIGVVVGVIAISLFLLGHFHPYPVAAILGTGWLLRSHRQEAHHQPESMSPKQAWAIFSIWLILFSTSLTVFLIVPATIKPENTHRALEILSHLWRSLS